MNRDLANFCQADASKRAKVMMLAVVWRGTCEVRVLIALLRRRLFYIYFFLGTKMLLGLKPQEIVAAFNKFSGTVTSIKVGVPPPPSVLEPIMEGKREVRQAYDVNARYKTSLRQLHA